MNNPSQQQATVALTFVRRRCNRLYDSVQQSIQTVLLPVRCTEEHADHTDVKTYRAPDIIVSVLLDRGLEDGLSGSQLPSPDTVLLFTPRQ